MTHVGQEVAFRSVCLIRHFFGDSQFLAFGQQSFFRNSLLGDVPENRLDADDLVVFIPNRSLTGRIIMHLPVDDILENVFQHLAATHDPFVFFPGLFRKFFWIKVGDCFSNDLVCVFTKKFRESFVDENDFSVTIFS